VGGAVSEVECTVAYSDCWALQARSERDNEILSLEVDKRGIQNFSCRIVKVIGVRRCFLPILAKSIITNKNALFVALFCNTLEEDGQLRIALEPALGRGA
jgi:hypothetical protein